MASGQVPKRSEERIRRNEPEIPIEKLEAVGEVVVPPLNLTVEPQQMTIDFYNSLAESAFAKYYEPSDWEYARLACFIMDTIVRSPKPSSEMYKALQTAMSNLLVTEGDRRRMRLEVVRANEKAQAEDKDAELIEMFQRQMTQAM
jgi:hypothetical protein